MSKKPLCSLIKCLREISSLFDFTVGNIKWCQNELRTQDNSSILLLLTIGKGNDWNIIKYHGDFFLRKIFNDGHEGHDNLGSHMVGQPILQLENLQFDIAKCTIDSIIII